MARPSKCRKICLEPVYDSFRPEGFPSDGTICLTLDEFEAIRLLADIIACARVIPLHIALLDAHQRTIPSRHQSLKKRRMEL